jgi:UDP-N-acetylglucosamine--N-acetylmuramyl-(pentapeptide) pyrophosphoryl-undecaprenol N-acetylglucosamine transferase
MKEKRVIISGGGTAGHLYPALAVGQKLKEKAPHLRLTYVGSGRTLERNIMKHHGADFIPLKIKGIKGKGWKAIPSLLLLPFSFLKSFWILISRKPLLVVGVGGYSSGPMVLLASWLRIPTLIMEQNLKPGFTNRLLIPWIRKAVVAFKESLPSFKGKGIFLGNPVRDEFYGLSPKEENGKLTILVFGGSQGSHFLNQSLVSSLPLLKKEKDRLRIFHQTGEEDCEWVKQNYQEMSFQDATVAPYFHDMPQHFQKSDLIISRAGATTIAELIASKKASILIPFSKATDNHQLFNARELERTQGAEVILEEEFDAEGFSKRILEFLRSQNKIRQMEKNLETLKSENAAERIASLCLEMMEKK